MKKLIAILSLLWAGGAGAYWYWTEGSVQAVRFRTVTVGRGDLTTTVNATGTIEPEEVVDVGAQVAGEILGFGDEAGERDRAISYGSKVEKGTVLARLDDKLFKARVDQMKASLARAEADVQQALAKLHQAERDLERTRKLQSRGPGLLAAQDLDNALATYESSRAGLAVSESGIAVARANLEEAAANLGYTTIRSPVKGVILDRRVNIGQTVVASLNAPSLFLIAKDLGRLEIWASVNETDIGSIHPGQEVRFGVGSLPNEAFRGKVAQIRLNASMIQNVVTYTVVVTVDNAAGKLLPYLTARLEFEVDGHRGVLLVPKSALRWQPSRDHVVPEAREVYANSLKARANSRGGKAGVGVPNEGTLWVKQGEFVRPLGVQVGLADGSSAEVRGDSIREGMEVVVGIERADEDLTSFLPHARAAEKAADKDDAKKAAKD